MVYEAEEGNISFAVTGDAMITRRMQPFREKRFLEMVDLLRGADVSLVNLEMLFHNYEMSWQGKATHSFQVSEPRNLDELKWLGFDVVTTANNHSYDYSEAGFLATLDNVKEHDLLQAGGGLDVDEARAPTYLDTPGGRVAVMAGTSTYSEDSRAGPGRAGFPGKPGVNALGHNTVHYVRRHVFDALTEAKRELGYGAKEEQSRRFVPVAASPPVDPETEVRLFDQRFRPSDEYAVKTHCRPEDLEDISRWVRGAGRSADWRVYGMHCHESGTAGEHHGGSRLAPPDFLEEFARFTIDQGCQLFFAHGPHFLRGIEIYKNRPIFYSLGNFIFQNETVQWLPEPGYSGLKLGADATPGDWGWTRSGGAEYGFAADPVFYRSAIPVCTYENGDLKEIRIYPIDLGFRKSMGQRGRPVLADEPVAQQVLRWLQEVSAPYGTEISIEENVGVIRL